MDRLPSRGMSLVETVRALSEALDGVDYDAEAASACVRRMHELGRAASSDELAAALDVLVERIDRSRVEDADGVAHAAISAGTLVEYGAAPRPLGEVLLRKLPHVLSAARVFADRCLADLDGLDEPWQDVDERALIADVDGLPITRERFRQHLTDDRGGGCSLAYLTEWTLPTVAALTRDRELFSLAIDDATLRSLALRLRQSAAGWLHTLLATQLDARWRALCPSEQRGFELRVDGVSSNFDIKALVSEALSAAGLAGDRNPPDVIAAVRGDATSSSQGFVKGCFDFYTCDAIPFLGGPPGEIPFQHTVWGEGVPTDVPPCEGLRTVIVTPPTIARTWNAARPFSQLRPRVEVERELDPSEVRALLRPAFA